MRFASIASGSSGNCIYAGTDNTHILIDAGISKKRIESGLNEFGLSLKDIDAILVTHEHSDHIGGLGVVSRAYHIPIYATSKTIEFIKNYKNLGKIDEDLYNDITPDVSFDIRDIKVNPFSISHDAVDPVAYRVENADKSVAVATDMGVYDDYTISNLEGVNALLLEANHDVRMLQVGSYPYPLKQRILGDRGHLSNESSGQFLGQLLHDKFKKVVLGHLSKENNLAELAYETVRQEVEQGENPYHGNDFPIQVAKRDEVSELIRI